MPDSLAEDLALLLPSSHPLPFPNPPALPASNEPNPSPSPFSPAPPIQTPMLPATPPPTPVTSQPPNRPFTDLNICRSVYQQGGGQEVVIEDSEKATKQIPETETGEKTKADKESTRQRKKSDPSKKSPKKHRRENSDKSEDNRDKEERDCGGIVSSTDLRQGAIRNASTIRCKRPNCKRSLPTEEARVKFRTCSNCYTFYCSRQCRKSHYERHKSQCPRTRISNLCTQVLMKVREDPCSRRHLSICASRGFLSRGRGVVKLVFLNPEDALDYLCNSWSTVKGQTFYVPRSELMPREMGSEVFGQVKILCDKYNTERKFILLAAISVINEITTVSPDGATSVSLEREVVVRGVKMRLASTMSEDEVQTLICTVTKDPPHDGQEVTDEDLQKGLEAIETQMEERGVSLKDNYPDVYVKLRAFVEKREPFVPFNIFPADIRSGKMFMCILLPWADSEIIKKISSKTTVVRNRKKWIL